MKNTLVIFAHPYFEHSKASAKLLNCYHGNALITIRDLYEEYPDFHIQAFRERKRLKKYQRVVFHFPLIWFGMPPLLKLWIDEVLDAKWVDDQTDNPFQDMEVLIVATVGGSRDSYLADGKYHTAVELFSAGLNLSLELLNVKKIRHFYIYDADELSDEQAILYQDQLTHMLLN